MGLVIRLILSAIIGFLSHAFWQPTRSFGNQHGRRWGAKIRHAIGIITIAVPLAFVREKLDMSGEKNRTISALLLTALCYGGGNLLAHFSDKK